jgi:hypothetical protein
LADLLVLSQIQMKAKSTRIKVGTYQLGYRWVDLFIERDSESGNFTWFPDNPSGPKNPKSHAEIVVGVDGTEWAAWVVLVHEACEAIMSDMGLRFRPSNRYVERSSDLYTFHFDHNQFTEVAARLGALISDCRSDFVKSVKKIKK